MICKECKDWEENSWLCSNPKVGSSPHNDQGMREYKDACIKPADLLDKVVYTPLYTGPFFGCIHFTKYD